MKRILPIILIVLTVVLVAMATMQPSELSPATSPEGAVQSLVRAREGARLQGRIRLCSQNPAIPTSRHSRAICPDVTEACAPTPRCSRRTPRFSMPATTKPWFAPVLEYATAVGAFYDTRDLKVVKEDGELEGGMAGGEGSQGSAAGHPGKLPALGCGDPRR